MGKWRLTQWIFGLLILGISIAIFGFTEKVIVQVLASMLILLTLISTLFAKKYKAMNAQSQNVQDHKVLDIIAHYRHDVLNDLQMIFAYLKLKRYEQLQEYVNRMKTKLEQESSMVKLGIPSLFLYFITFRMENPFIELDIYVDPDIRFSPSDEQSEAGEHSTIFCETIIGLMEFLRLESNKIEQLIEKIKCTIHIRPTSDGVQVTCELENMADVVLDSEKLRSYITERRVKFELETAQHKRILTFIIPDYV